MTALVHVPSDEPAFYQREITATFENGGGIEITVRGESIAGVLEILLSTVAVVKLNPDRMFDVRLRYWHLTEDLDQVEVQSSECVVENYEDDPQRIVRRLAATAKASLVKSLARHGITLRGERGEL
ncbi:MAG: hypothetical protein P4N60_19320 [Verrucomicrobiae bacterium]|nr:hypothetical protein [Verrucomicrobiae bacterium]